MSVVVTEQPTGTGAPAATPVTGGSDADVGAGLHRLFGLVPSAVLWVLVLIWTIPTLGTFVSSFRVEDEVSDTGWWETVQFDGLAPLPAVVAGGLLGYLVFAWGQVGLEPATRQRLAWQLYGLAVAAVVVAAVVFSAATTDVALDVVAGLVLGLLAGAVALLGSWRWLAAVGVGVLGLLWLWARIVPDLQTDQLTADNYTQVFSADGRINMWDHFFNSVAITIPGTVIPVAIAAFAAYAFAWMEFRGRHWLFVGIVALLAVPLQMSLVPLLQLWNNGAHLTVFGETLTLFPDLDLQGTTTAVWLSHVGFGLPLAVFLLHNYMAALPRDLIEAARIDGADHPTIFWRLILPLSVPALAAFAIFQFLWVWNDYLVANTFLGTAGAGLDNAPMTIRLATLSGSYGGDWHLMTAAAFVSIVLPVTVFFALQRFFVRGLLAGSVKG